MKWWDECTRFIAVLCLALASCLAAAVAQEDSGKKKSTTYGLDENKMAGVVLTLTPSGKQFSVTGYYYLKPLAGITADPGMRTPIKGVYSPSTGKLRARAVFTDKSGAKSEIPVNAKYDAANDAFEVEIDTRYIVPRDQTRPDEIYKPTGGLMQFSCEWTAGDKIDLTAKQTGADIGTMPKVSDGEDHHHPPKANANKKP
jgi:hypothetical protein